MQKGVIKILLSLLSEIRLSKPKIMITVKLCKRCAHSKFSICRCQSKLLKQQKSVLSVKKKNKVWCMSDLKGVLMLVPDPPSPPPLCSVSLDTLLRFCPIYMVIPLNNCSFPSSTTSRSLLYIPSIHPHLHICVLSVWNGTTLYWWLQLLFWQTEEYINFLSLLKM